MDKKTTRKILFIKGNKYIIGNKIVGAVAPDKKPKEKKAENPGAILDRSKKLYAWLNSRPLINLNGVCLKVSIDRANFVKGMKKEKELRLDVLKKLTDELKQYGYVE